jgi:hypothetical protein
MIMKLKSEATAQGAIEPVKKKNELEGPSFLLLGATAQGELWHPE